MNDTTELMDNWENFEEPILEIDFEENVVADQGRPHSHSSLFLLKKSLFTQNATPQICRVKFVRFADLLHMWHFADLRFADPIFFVTCKLWTSEKNQIYTFNPNKYDS